MSIRYLKSMAACAFAVSLCLCAPVKAQEEAAMKSATLARDVNGFRLGMTIAEANALAPLTPTGGENFETKKDGIAYSFGVTPMGRIYRVESTQEIGKFAVDGPFLITLERRLTEKYGKPSMISGEVFWWNLTEIITNNFGQDLPFTTMVATAMIGGIGGDNTLEISLIDYRILWSDRAVANRKPRESAEGAFRF